MKVIVMTAPGEAANVLQQAEQEAPEIQHDHEIKIAIHAAGVNPVDTKLRAGGVFYDNALPAVLGCDGAGEVVATGAAVSQFEVGDRVWYCHGGLGREQGNYAEYNVLPEDRVVPMPSIPYEQAAAGPLVLITAWEALFDRARLEAGQTVLIHAGAGGVGHVAIQLAKIHKARVITTVSSEAKAEFVRSLGADEVIFYQREDVNQRCLAMTNGKGVDVVFDTIGQFQQSFAALKVYGQLVTLLDPGTVEFNEARNRNLGLHFTLMLTPMLRDDLQDARAHQCEILKRCRQYINAGKLNLHVSESLPLDQATKAHQMIESGHTVGKIILKVS